MGKKHRSMTMNTFTPSAEDAVDEALAAEEAAIEQELMELGAPELDEAAPDDNTPTVEIQVEEAPQSRVRTAEEVIAANKARLAAKPAVPEVTRDSRLAIDKGRDTILVYANDFNDKRYIHVREWYTDKAGELKPSKSGTALPVARIPELIEALTAIYNANK